MHTTTTSTTAADGGDLLAHLELRRMASSARNEAQDAADALVDQVLAAGTFLELAAQLAESSTGGDTRVSSALRELSRSATLADASRRGAKVLADHVDREVRAAEIAALEAKAGVR